MDKKWKRFRYKADAITFIKVNNLPLERLGGTNGKWYVSYYNYELKETR